MSDPPKQRKDYEVDLDPAQYEDEGIDVDQGADPNEGEQQPEYLEEPPENDA